MKLLSQLFLKGLAVILPITLTVYVFFWLGSYAESVVQARFEKILGTQYYFPGLGILGGMLIILLMGLLAELWIVKWLVSAGEGLFLRIPLVKIICGGLKDLMSFVTSASDGKSVGKTVMVSIGNDMQLMGLVTRSDFSDLPRGIGDKNTVAVYLPMSYQLGGFTVYLPKDKTQPIDMPSNNAMRFTFTAGISLDE
jgi:uncharacterized membrane protein